jgi:hypothetical protein
MSNSYSNSNWFLHQGIQAKEIGAWLMEMSAKQAPRPLFLVSINPWNAILWEQYLGLEVCSLGKLSSEIKSNAKGDIVFLDYYFLIEHYWEEVNFRRLLDFSGGELFIWAWTLNLEREFSKNYELEPSASIFKFEREVKINKKKESEEKDEDWFENLKNISLKKLKRKQFVVIVINVDWVVLKLGELLKLYGWKGMIVRKKSKEKEIVEREGQDFIISYWPFSLDLIHQIDTKGAFIYWRSFGIPDYGQEWWQFQLGMIHIKE